MEDGFTITQPKKIDELQPIDVQGEDKDLYSAEIISALRSEIGKMMYVAKETTPTLSALASLTAQRMPNPTIGDVRSFNASLRKWRKLNRQPLKITRMDEGSVHFKAYADASWTSAVMSKQKVGDRAKCARKNKDFNLNLSKAITKQNRLCF